MSETIEHSDKVNFALDICEWMSEQGNRCYYKPRVGGIDSIELSMSTFRSFDLAQLRHLASLRGIQITSWACYGEFTADRLFTVSLYLVQIRSNGNG